MVYIFSINKIIIFYFKYLLIQMYLHINDLSIKFIHYYNKHNNNKILLFYCVNPACNMNSK